MNYVSYDFRHIWIFIFLDKSKSCYNHNLSMLLNFVKNESTMTCVEGLLIPKRVLDVCMQVINFTRNMDLTNNLIHIRRVAA